MTSKNRNFLDSRTVVSIDSIIALRLELLQEKEDNPKQSTCAVIIGAVDHHLEDRQRALSR